MQDLILLAQSIDFVYKYLQKKFQTERTCRS